MTSRDKLWEPDPARVANTQMFQFLERVASQHGIEKDWDSLRRWSVDSHQLFWSELLEFVGIEPTSAAETVLEGTGMQDRRWFPGMRLNYARHMLRWSGSEPAIHFESEREIETIISRDELRDRVARLAAAFRAEGVRSGDRVAGFLPNIPEAIIAMLAAASLGAVWSSCSPDFGVAGVLDRFGQIAPKVLVVADGYSYAGKPCPTMEVVGEMLPGLPSVERVVVVPFLDPDFELGGGPERAVLWGEYLGSSSAPTPPLEFEEVDFDHPLFVMYSSGTTGVPKCIVHGHGGTLLQHMKELQLHCDLRERERIFYFTTCGWMMWNWLASGLGVGATVVLYEGNPGFPSLSRLWGFAERVGIHVFGTSPKFLAACQNAGIHPGRDHDLSALRAMLSTGSPLSDEQFRWVYDEIKSDLQLSSISGGTDIISCFMLGNPMLPVFAGAIQCRGLGMAVAAWDETGEPVVGEKGELVCTVPFPSQPVGFWNDPDGQKYHEAYFDYFPGIWRHGDFIEVTEGGEVIVYGRSDATLNPGGVRIGTAEIYRVVEELEMVTDSLVVGVPDEDDVAIVLFVVLRDGDRLDDSMRKEIRSLIGQRCTKRHVPARVEQVAAVPYTISGKKVELAVQKVLTGEPVKNRDALANPDSLDQFQGILDGS